MPDHTPPTDQQLAQPEAIVQTTCYEVSVLPEDDINRTLFTINVELRGHDTWAVVRHRQCMNAKGEWSWESIPSEREDEWLAEHRFNRMTALELAKWAAPRIVVNGETAVDAYRRTRPAVVPAVAETGNADRDIVIAASEIELEGGDVMLQELSVGDPIEIDKQTGPLGPGIWVITAFECERRCKARVRRLSVEEIRAAREREATARIYE